MKPTNTEESGCSPISSNCVIWQGPDIPCITLCKGDTVSDVVFKMATELCGLLDLFDVNSFDFACLDGSDCAPEDFQALLQLIIDRICQLEGITPIPTPGSEGCPDCVVNIASCFYFQNPQGDTETTMQLIDYVTAIGNRVCQLVGEINTINQTLANHGNRIEALEQAPAPVLVLPTVTPVCVLPAVATPMDAVLTALETQFCQLIGATGGAINIYGAVATQCAALDQGPQLAGTGVMGTIPGWQLSANNLAESINNIWLTICDIRSAILNIQSTCCPTVCDAIDVTLTAAFSDPSTLKVYFTGNIPVGFVECNPMGTQVTITDQSGGTATVTVPVVSNMNNAAGFSIALGATPINPAENLTVTMTLCLTDAAGTQCQTQHTHLLINTQNCPVLNLIPTANTIDYSFTWVAGAAIFEVELYDVSGTSLLQSQTTGVGGPGGVNGTFSGLLAGVQYLVRINVTVGGSTSICPFYPSTTIAPPCTPPFNVIALLTIP